MWAYVDASDKRGAHVKFNMKPYTPVSLRATSESVVVDGKAARDRLADMRKNPHLSKPRRPVVTARSSGLCSTLFAALHDLAGHHPAGTLGAWQ
jgi:hypothetical protein